MRRRAVCGRSSYPLSPLSCWHGNALRDRASPDAEIRRETPRACSTRANEVRAPVIDAAIQIDSHMSAPLVHSDPDGPFEVPGDVRRERSCR